MTTSNATPKIVVGLGLAVVFAIGISMFAMQTRTLPQTQTAFNSEPPPAADPATVDPATAATSATAAMPAQDLAVSAPEPARAPSAAPPAAAPSVVEPPVAATPKPAKAKKAARVNRDPARTTGEAIMPANALAAVSSPETAVPATTPAPAVASVAVPEGTTSAAPAPAANAAEAAAPAAPESPALTAAPATPAAPVASDSQITASVKAELAAAAPDSKVDVSTNQGVVSLIGQVASADTIALAKQAAERVPGVRAIDTSAMTVSNQ